MHSKVIIIINDEADKIIKILFDSHRNRYQIFLIMPSEGSKILEFNQYQKSDKAPFIIYAELKCIIGKIEGCKNNLKIRL